MIRILFSVLILPAALFAHEGAGTHLHPHGVEWLPALVLLVAAGLAVYLFRRIARR